jgi:uncharacterized membrane protein YgcG
MSRIPLASLLVLAVILRSGAAYAATATTTTTTVNFDDLPAFTDVGTVDGATFSRGVEADDATTGLAHSPASVARQCVGMEFCRGPFIVTFASPQQRVELYVGYAGTLGAPFSLTLVAYDANGDQVAHSDASIPARTGHIAPMTALAVTAQANSIASVSLDAGGSEGVPEQIAVDDVTFSAAAALPDLALSDVTAHENAERTAFKIGVLVQNAGGAVSSSGMVTASAATWPKPATAKLPALAPGDRKHVILTLPIPAGTPAGQVTAHVSVAPGEGEASAENNSKDVTLDVQIPSTGGGGGGSSGGGSGGGGGGGSSGGGGNGGGGASTPVSGPAQRSGRTGGHGLWHGYRPIIPFALAAGGALLYRTRRAAHQRPEPTHEPEVEFEIEVDRDAWQLKATDRELPKRCTTGGRICRKEGSLAPHLRELVELRVKSDGDAKSAAVTGRIVEKLNDARDAARLGRRRDAGPLVRAAAEDLRERLIEGSTHLRPDSNVALAAVLEGSEVECTFTLYRCTGGHGDTPWEKELTWRAKVADRTTVQLGEIPRAELTSRRRRAAIAHLERMLAAIAGDGTAAATAAS